MTQAWQAPADVALLRVDIQNGFCPGGNLPVAGGDEIVAGVNALAQHFRVKGDSQDWHPEGHSSFASTHGEDPFTQINMSYGPQTLWPDHCVQGTMDAELRSDLLRGANDFLIRKGTNKKVDSYSAFYENDRVTQPRMEDGRTMTEYLKDHGIKRLVLTGLAYDFCVGWTALDAVREGFEVIVVRDATRSIGIPVGDGVTTETLMDKQLADAGVKVVHSSALQAALGVRVQLAPAAHP